MEKRNKSDVTDKNITQNMGKNRSSHRIAFLGMFIAIAMVLSYVESLIPLSFAVPGIKLGLANMVTIIVIFKMRVADAWIVAIVRVILSSILFGNMTVMLYSLAGAFASLMVMTIFRRINFFSMVGVSILGAVCHNAGQIATAAWLLRNSSIFYYIPALMVSGCIAGVCIGIAGAAVIRNVHFGCF